MALEELIVAWSQDRPAWQRMVMRHAALGQKLSDADYDQLLDLILAGSEPADATFGLEHLPHTSSESPPVRLVSIEKPAHVNALESKQPLTFEPAGLTIVYGDNGSGKSGYARLLKRIARSRHQEDVLSDVFRDTSLAKPTASLRVRVGDSELLLAWPDDARPELRQMLFYDATCGHQYIAQESDFPYRPAALAVMDRLIEACLAIRARADEKLAENARTAKSLPTVPETVASTDAGKFLAGLSSTTPIETLDRLIRRFDESPVTIEGLEAQDASLRAADSTKERSELTRQAEKLDAVRAQLERLRAALGDNALAELQQERDHVRELEGAATLAARAFATEPLSGVGSSSWKALWESARRYSTENAYPGSAFPVLAEAARCVLCQQALDDEGRNRLDRFDKFIRDDLQVRLQKARMDFEARVRGLDGATKPSDAVAGNLRDLEASHSDLVGKCRATLASCESMHAQVKAAIAKSDSLPRFAFDPGEVTGSLTVASQTARENATRLADPLATQQRLAELRSTRMELELLRSLKASRAVIVDEIRRLQQRDALEAAKSSAATTGITKKMSELSEASITEVVSNRFIRETERLQLQRVTITRTRADKGVLLHQPKLVNPRQQVALPKVFSEGERTALGLAAFFTEAELDASRSALILDDPVTSLDHIRRELVASRLTALAESRQVIVFTHDAAFVADLKREAKQRAVHVADRSVVRSRAEERKPGSCAADHPWKAKDVAERLQELREELARIKRESPSWDGDAYDDAVAGWAGRLSETWERIFSQEIVGPVLAEGGLEVRPLMVKVIARFTDEDYREFDASYSQVSRWARRHDKSAKLNYTAPEVAQLEEELARVDAWFKRVKKYKDK